MVVVLINTGTMDLAVKSKCAPGSNTTKDDKKDRKGIYEYHPGGVNYSITPGVWIAENGSYVTVRLRNSIDNHHYIKCEYSNVTNKR